MGVLTKALRPQTGPGIFWPHDYSGSIEHLASGYGGVSVTPENAWGLPGWFAGVRNIAEDVGKLPWITYERIEVDVAGRTRQGKRRAAEHPLYRVLHDVANPEMTAMAWKSASIGHVLTWGNCYSEIVRNGLGEVVELWPIGPHRVTPKRDPETRARFYRVRLPAPNEDGEYTVDLPASKIFHVPGFGYDGLVGYNVVEIMARSLSLGLAAQEHGERFWANNARPGGVLEVPAGLELSDTAKNKLRSQFRAGHEGLSNAQRFALLEDGIKFVETGIPPETAQYLETRLFQLREHARGLRIAPHKIGDLERATFSNIEQQALEYTQDTLGAHLGRFDAQAKKDLLTRPDDAPFFSEHLVDALLKADSLTRYRVYAIGRAIGTFCANDILERENMPPRTDPGGEAYQIPLNVTTEGAAGPSSGAGSLGSPEDVVKTTIVSAPDPHTTNGNGRTPQEVTTA